MSTLTGRTTIKMSTTLEVRRSDIRESIMNAITKHLQNHITKDIKIELQFNIALQNRHYVKLTYNNHFHEFEFDNGRPRQMLPVQLAGVYFKADTRFVNVSSQTDNRDIDLQIPDALNLIRDTLMAMKSEKDAVILSKIVTKIRERFRKLATGFEFERANVKIDSDRINLMVSPVVQQDKPISAALRDYAGNILFTTSGEWCAIIRLWAMSNNTESVHVINLSDPDALDRLDKLVLRHWQMVVIEYGLEPPDGDKQGQKTQS